MNRYEHLIVGLSAIHRLPPEPQMESRRISGGRGPARNGIERTLNGTGYMITSLDRISAEFVEFAGEQSHLPSLDIGAAFGVATHAALAQGARIVANDIDPQHLDVLKQRTSLSDRDRLTTAAGAFPNELSFPDGMFSAALLSRVMHFFDGEQVERSIARLDDWLATGGKAFVVVEASLFLDRPLLKEQYESKKKAGARWPGFVADVKSLLPERAGFIPDQLHYLDPEVLSREFERAGFEIEFAGHFQRPDDPREPDSPVRENVGLIARKPA